MKIFKQLYIVSSTYSKHGGKFYPNAPKSKSYKGSAVSNSWMQSEFRQRTLPTLQEVRDRVKSLVPKATNIKIEYILKD